MLTVTKLAKKYSISRATLLYYEREGLLAPSARSENGYRWYGEKEAAKLETIISYRSFGMPIAEIRDLLNQGDDVDQVNLLRAQFEKLEQEIMSLRKQQKAIVSLLQQPELLEKNMVTKDRWVEIMAATGFSEDDMRKWHINFEKMEPQEHQKFLESLGIESDEIAAIRAFK